MMKKKLLMVAFAATLATLLPLVSHAQGIGDDLHSLQGILRKLYDQMMPLCSQLTGIARAIAGFAALFYIGARVWRHIAANETVEVYPLLRPFALGFCIVIFPQVLGLLNGILEPVVTVTEGMVQNSHAAVLRLTQDRSPEEENNELAAPEGTDTDKWYQYSHPDEVTSNPIASAFSGWSIKNWARKFIAEVLNVLFQAAALCLDTIRTFKLIVLSVLGPLCFGLSVFDGFQHTLKQWIARYVNVFMWLPVANIFGAIIGKIQENMILAADGQQMGNAFGNESTAYLIFLLIAIVGYFTVPSISNYIMNVGGHALFNRTSALFSQATSFASGLVAQNVFKQQPPPPTQPTNYQTQKLQGDVQKT